eukprot:1519772-Prymnesium_polylepis.2
MVAVRWGELPWLGLELPSSCHGCRAVASCRGLGLSCRRVATVRSAALGLAAYDPLSNEASRSLSASAAGSPGSEPLLTAARPGSWFTMRFRIGKNALGQSAFCWRARRERRRLWLAPTSDVARRRCSRLVEEAATARDAAARRVAVSVVRAALRQTVEADNPHSKPCRFVSTCPRPP